MKYFLGSLIIIIFIFLAYKPVKDYGRYDVTTTRKEKTGCLGTYVPPNSKPWNNYKSTYN